jgi:formate-dependent phosphoribosylglycinamide formyltransferase (GAR transformylase)
MHKWPHGLLSWEDLTMSERVVDDGQSWASDIIGVVSGVGLYSFLFFLVTFLCLYVPA